MPKARRELDPLYTENEISASGVLISILGLAALIALGVANFAANTP